MYIFHLHISPNIWLPGCISFCSVMIYTSTFPARIHLKILPLTACYWFMGFKVMFVTVQLKVSPIQCCRKSRNFLSLAGIIHDEWRGILPLAKTKSFRNRSRDFKRKHCWGGLRGTLSILQICCCCTLHRDCGTHMLILKYNSVS